MQLTNALASLILLAAAGVKAAPGTPVQERQATPTVYAQFFNGGGCQGPWLDDTVFAQNTNDCVNNTISANYGSTFFSGNTLTRTLRLYELSGCPVNQGRFFDLVPGQQGTGCFAQHIGSAKFV
ncbi:hypothetical protein BCR34DRAFT_617416 [Clohesyomyces aquaticus]|uniref:Uncharacterized protein n=1 Tax=Clohesyomyces aquaticus TaxID=1231657 RepID=A0A1Y1Z327_9PLEO|nr:hypothetical protein BCR34DRAFT_617416 [Clohesyomyces aquaticus]